LPIWQGRSRRKATGGRYKHFRKHRKREMGRPFAETKIGKTKVVAVRTKGGGVKVKLYQAEYANVSDPGSGETKRVKIIDVIESPAHPHYSKRNIITKGSIIKTELGDARVTSRPGQNGVVNAVLLKR